MNVQAERAKAVTTLVIDAVLIFNIFAQMAGWSPVSVDYDTVYEGVSAVLMVVALVYSWWKNQNVTVSACVAQETCNALKDAERE